MSIFRPPLDLYRTMRDEELQRLRAAFMADRENLSGAQRAFADGRIKAIDETLAERAAPVPQRKGRN
jgi:hypothetical protein